MNILINIVTRARSIKLVTSFLCFGLLSACVTGPKGSPITAQAIGGNWYGERWVGEEKTIWLTERQPSGEFTTRFRRCNKGKSIFFQRKTGRWALRGSKYTTTTTEISDGAQVWQPATPNREFRETFTLQKLSNTELRYKDQDRKYIAYKVEDDYTLSCK